MDTTGGDKIGTKNGEAGGGLVQLLFIRLGRTGALPLQAGDIGDVRALRTSEAICVPCSRKDTSHVVLEIKRRRKGGVYTTSLFALAAGQPPLIQSDTEHSRTLGQDNVFQRATMHVGTLHVSGTCHKRQFPSQLAPKRHHHHQHHQCGLSQMGGLSLIMYVIFEHHTNNTTTNNNVTQITSASIHSLRRTERMSRRDTAQPNPPPLPATASDSAQQPSSLADVSSMAVCSPLMVQSSR